MISNRDSLRIVQGGGSPRPSTLRISGVPSAATEGQPYSWAPAITGGTPPRTVSIPTGMLPDGLSLNSSTGAITGTPTEGGSFNLVIRVSDSDSQTADLPVTLTVAPLEPALLLEDLELGLRPPEALLLEDLDLLLRQ